VKRTISYALSNPRTRSDENVMRTDGVIILAENA
jgi:hypothetical protein